MVQFPWIGCNWKHYKGIIMRHNNKHQIGIGLFLFFNLALKAQDAKLINVYNREHLSLNGAWNYIVDPYETGFYNYRYQPFDAFENPGSGAFFTNTKPVSKTDLVEYDFDKADTINVPGDWNSQKEKLFYYEGTIWYKKSFDYSNLDEGQRSFVYFGAANYRADVYLNGKKLGSHVGGFTPFYFETTGLLKPKDNFLIVKVDNKRLKEGVPTLNTDWWNYGGITRNVSIVQVSQNYIADYLIQLNPDNEKEIKGFIQLNGKAISNKAITIEIPELKISKNLQTNASGLADLQLVLKKVSYWSPENPKLYEVVIRAGADMLSDQIGFRTIKTEGTKILLNDAPVYLKGISIHEENALRGGRAYSMEDAELLLGYAKELGCNYVRLAHYPHNEHMVRLADKMGMMVWEENPVYWTIQWENPETYKNAENQLTEAINRDKNRASVIIWSMANETPNSGARLNFLTQLAAKTGELDNTRLISAALEQSSVDKEGNIRTIHDPFADVVDVLSFNQYIGWYDGLADKCRKISWQISQNKPVLISEFGAGALQGYHADSLTRWSEEYQEYVYKETLDMISRIPQLSGFSPWILVDFRSPRRMLAGIQDGWNRKGLISEKGKKKKAFFVLQKFYKVKQ